MLGSGLRGSVSGGTPQGYTDQVDEDDTESSPPMYNPRTSWGGDDIRKEQPEPEFGPRTTQDMMDLEEENRVLRREVARLQQLNEARRKQLVEMQARLDEYHDWGSPQRQQMTATTAPSSPRPRPGGGGAPGRKSQSPTREVSPDNEKTARINRLEQVSERWKQKAIQWEERYSILWNEISKVERSSTNTPQALVEALHNVAYQMSGHGLDEQVDMEEGIEILKTELVKAKETIIMLTNKLYTTVASSPETSPKKTSRVSVRAPSPTISHGSDRYFDSSPEKVEQPQQSQEELADELNTEMASLTTQVGTVCLQCADYRLKLAELNQQVSEDEQTRRNKELQQNSFPFANILPGMEQLSQSMQLALHGRDASYAALELTTEYIDTYLSMMREIFPSNDVEETAFSMVQKLCTSDEEE